MKKAIYESERSSSMLSPSNPSAGIWMVSGFLRQQDTASRIGKKRNEPEDDMTAQLSILESENFNARHQ